MSERLLKSLEGGVMRLTLNDAATRNSLSEAMMADLQAALDQASADRAVRAIVLAALGPAFSSGHNLKEIIAHRADADKGASYFAQLFSDCARLMLSIVRSPKPVIAEVAGLASAAGCQLVASCDLAIAADTARFCTPGVNIGLFCSTPMVALSRNVMPKHAMEMLLTGDVIDADEAARIGLVNHVVPANALGEAVDALARKIASKSLATVKIGKQAFYRQRDLPLEEAYAYTAKVMTENLLQRDAEEGISAFIAKRPPVWSDET
jgi:enoyl-CoA hydratase/carnithine racemase